MFFGVSHIANEKMRLKLNVAFSYVVRERFGQMKNENICIFVFQLYAVNSYSCRVLTQHLIDNFVTHLTLLISSFCFCFVLFKWVCVGFALYLSKNFLQVKNDPQLKKCCVESMQKSSSNSIFVKLNKLSKLSNCFYVSLALH